MLNVLAADHEFKKSEMIVCFPQSLFPQEPGVHCVKDPAVIDALYKSMNNNVVIASRDFANANTATLRQLATYCAIYKRINGELRIAAYYRSGGDAKLQGKRSIGYGGHPDIDDAAFELSDTIMSSAHREINEEVMLLTASPELIDEAIPFYGFILDNTGGIESYHIGTPLKLEVPADTQANSVDPENDKFAGWLTLAELQVWKEEGKLENWSVKLLDHIVEHGL